MFPQRRLARRPARLVIGAAAAVLAVGGMCTALAVRDLERNIRTVDVSADLGSDRPAVNRSREAVHGPLNILVIGSDSRSGANGFIGGPKDRGRSDTTLVLHLAAANRHALAVSIPRDSMVRLPDCVGRDGLRVPGGIRQFNEAYTIGGVACTQRTVEKLSGERMDHYAVVDFAGFRDVVDALGTVEICLPHAVHDPLAALDLPSGRQRVGADRALGYVRTRHGLGDGGDLSRVARQQAFLSAVLQETMSGGTLANPRKLYRVLNATSRAITVDPGLGSLSGLAALARRVRSVGLENIRFVTVPTVEYGPDHNRLQWAPEARNLWRAVADDRPVMGGGAPSAPRTPRAGPQRRPPTAPAVTLPGVRQRTASDDVCS